MNLRLVCSRNKKHTFDSPSLYLAQNCHVVLPKSIRCIGVMAIDEPTQKKLGISKEKVGILIGQLVFSQLVGLPYKRVTAGESRGKKMVWIGSKDNPKNGYFRCGACGALNSTMFHADVHGNSNICDICLKCEVHQFLYLEGWNQYQEEMRRKS